MSSFSVQSLTEPTVLAALLWATFALMIFVTLFCVMTYFSRRKDSQSISGNVDQLAEEVRNANRYSMQQYESVRKDFLTVSSDLKNTQSQHFVNFLGLISTQADNQNQQTARLQTTLSEQLQMQTQTQDKRLESLTSSVAQTIGQMRSTLAEELDVIRQANDKALEGMRQTVDDKLQTTLNARLTTSFKTVEEQLAAVHKGLGEMREMAQNVDGLRRVLTNVKTRGTFGEIQLGMILEQILTPAQYDMNVATRPGSSERVEFAVRLPGRGALPDKDFVYLPIDAKFPLEDYERLMQASEKADAKAVEESLKALSARIVLEARKIHDKYVEVPYTTEFAILYLPVEGLWSEVVRMPGLLERLQREFHVTVAGPTVLTALLNSLQMGFKTLAIEKKSAEVWQLLGEVKMEFIRFAEVVESLDKKLESMRTTVGQVRTRTNVMSRRLKDVECEDVAREEKTESAKSLTE